MMRELDLGAIFVERVPHELPHVRVFRRNIINVLAKTGFRARNGTKGQADFYALVVGGLHVEIETKAARGVMREAQERWALFCARWRVPHLVLRAGKSESPDETVSRWIDELRAVVGSEAA